MPSHRPQLVTLLPTPSELVRALRPWASRTALISALDESRLKGLKAALGSDDSIEAEVVPWGELLGRVLQRVGRPVGRLASPRQTELAIGASLATLDPDRPLAHMARFGGFHRRVGATLRQLRHFGVDAVTMRGVVGELTAEVRPIIEDLATVAEALTERWQRLGRETTVDRMLRLLETPREGWTGMAHWEPWWVLVGPDDDPIARQLFTSAAAAGVTICLAVEGIPGRPDLFVDQHVWQSAFVPPVPMDPNPQRQLSLDFEGEDGAVMETVSVGRGPWWMHLFEEGPPAGSEGESFPIRRFAAPNALAEAEWALRDAQALISAGAMPHRIAIVGRDEATYAPRLEFAAERLGVPLDAHRVIPLVQNAFVRWLVDLLTGLAAADPRALESAILSVYPDPQRTAASDRLRRLYALRQSATPWADLRSDAEGEGESARWLTTALAWRDTALREPAPLPEWFRRLEDLLRTPPLPDTVGGPENPTSERDLRAQAAALRALSDAVSTLDAEGMRPCGLAEFVRQIRQIWDHETTALPSSQRDGVRYVSRPEELGVVDHVIAIGMVEGTFPRRRREDAVLRDEDRHALSVALQLPAALPDSRQEARRERDAFVRLAALARRSLTVAYPLESGDREAIPTFYVTELGRRDGVALTDFGTRPAWIEDPVTCQFRADLALAEAFRMAVEVPDERGLQTVALRQRLVIPEAGVLPDEVADAYLCPFRFAFRHRLRLRSRRTISAYYRLVELPARAALSAAPDPEAARRQLESARDDVMAELAGDLDAWERDLWRAAADRLTADWIGREFRARNLWVREDLGEAAPGMPVAPENEAFEATFGDQPLKLRATVAGRYRAAGRTVLRVYRSRLPDLASAEDPINSDDIRIGLTLMLARRALKTPVAIEVETLGDARGFYAPAADGKLPMLSPEGKGLQVKFVGKETTYAARIKEVLHRTAPELRLPSMAATPGRHCEQCDFAELCRRDHHQGEAKRVTHLKSAGPGVGWSPEGLTDPEDA